MMSSPNKAELIQSVATSSQESHHEVDSSLYNQELSFLDFPMPDRAIEKIALLQFKQDLDERKNYAKKTYRLIPYSLLFIFVITCAHGFSHWTTFKISDNVLLALIGGVTVNVLGTYFIILKNLFPQYQIKDSLTKDSVKKIIDAASSLK